MDVTGAKDVYIVEASANIPEAVDDIRDLSGGRAHIYLPHRFKQIQVADLSKDDPDIDILTFESINGSFDDRLFAYAQAVSIKISRRFVEKQLQWAFFVSLQDAIVARIRPAMQLAHYREIMPLGHLYWRPNIPGQSTTLWEALSTVHPEVMPIRGGIPVKSSLAAALKIAGGGRRRRLHAAQLEASLTGADRLIVTCALGDQQYRNTVLPFVRHTLSKRDVTLVPSASLGEARMAPFFAEHRLDAFIEAGRLRVIEDTEIVPISPTAWDDLIKLNKISRSLIEPFEGFEDWEPIYGQLLRDIALSESTRVAGECRVLWEQCVRLAARSTAVVVCPGRPMRSTILVAAAKMIGKASIEIQSGTIAKSRRFVAPQAGRVLVMDQESRDTYAHLGRTKGVEIVGSIRLDHDLRNFRAITRENAREQIGFDEHRTLWTLASQPIGAEAMARIASVVLRAAEACGASLMIKMHPNETTAYEQAYRQLGRQHGSVDLIIERDMRSVLAVIASDVVLTHFSTVGIEAYALGRLTIVVNPFEERPTFDLVSMNVALGAREPEDIVRIVRDREELSIPANQLTDGKALERCEYWVKRSISQGAEQAPSVEVMVPASKDGEIVATPVALSRRELRQTLTKTMSRVWRRAPEPIRIRLMPLARIIRTRLIGRKR